MDIKKLFEFLQENEKQNDITEILNSLNDLKNVFEKTSIDCKGIAGTAGENFDFEKLESIQKIKSKIDVNIAVIENIIDSGKNFQTTVNNVKETSSPINDASEEADLNIISLKDTLTFKIPTKCVIDESEIQVNSWKQVLISLLSFFAKKDITKFIQYVNFVNNKNLVNYKFYNRNENHVKSFYIEPSDKSAHIHGSSNDIGRFIQELLTFFEYTDKCKIYGSKKEYNSDLSDTREVTDINYSVGDLITHQIFGMGTVEEINNEKIVIDFGDSIGKKEFLSNFDNMADIKPVVFDYDF